MGHPEWRSFWSAPVFSGALDAVTSLPVQDRLLRNIRWPGKGHLAFYGVRPVDCRFHELDRGCLDLYRLVANDTPVPDDIIIPLDAEMTLFHIVHHRRR